MGKRTTWYIIILLATIATVSILLQLRNFSYVTSLYNDYFETLAQRALDEVSRSLEQDEVERQLHSVSTQDEVQSFCRSNQDTISYKLETCGPFSTSYISDGSEVWNGYGNPERATCPPWARARKRGQSKAHARFLQNRMLNTYFYHRSMLDEVVLRTILEHSNRPLRQRVNVDFLQQALVRELAHVGITEDFEFTLYDRRGQNVYTTADTTQTQSRDKQLTLKRDLFVRSNSYLDTRDEGERLPYLEVTFVNHSSHIGSLIYMLPSFATLLVIILLSMLAIGILLRQQHFMRERKDFVSSMTHELRTPVSSIRLACEMLVDPSMEKSEERRKRITQTMLKEVDRLTLLVDQVLQSSSMERGVLKTYPVELDAHEEIEDLSSAYAMKLAEVQGELQLHLDAPQHTLKCDKIAFQNIISNVIDNSLKYRKEDTPPIITVTTHSDATKLIIDLEDNGIGISRQDQAHIFDQFYRVHTGDRHDVKGFGLGLAYVQRAVQAMGGSIRVFSKLGEGTRMSLCIPLFIKSAEASTDIMEK